MLECRTLPTPSQGVAASSPRPMAEVDGNPPRVAFPQRVESNDVQKGRLRVTLRVTTQAEAQERRRAPTGTTRCDHCLPGVHNMRMVRRMPRVQVYLPDDLHDELKKRGLPASELLQIALRAELERQDALDETARYLEELVAEVGEPSTRQQSQADAIARRIRDRSLDRVS